MRNEIFESDSVTCRCRFYSPPTIVTFLPFMPMACMCTMLILFLFDMFVTLSWCARRPHKGKCSHCVTFNNSMKIRHKQIYMNGLNVVQQSFSRILTHLLTSCSAHSSYFCDTSEIRHVIDTSVTANQWLPVCQPACLSTTLPLIQSLLSRQKTHSHTHTHARKHTKISNFPPLYICFINFTLLLYCIYDVVLCHHHAEIM